MSDKNKVEFDKFWWEIPDFFGACGAAYFAWQHQQAIIDARDAEIVNLKNTAAELATTVIELERKK